VLLFQTPTKSLYLSVFLSFFVSLFVIRFLTNLTSYLNFLPFWVFHSWTPRFASECLLSVPRAQYINGLLTFLKVHHIINPQ
jgi:TRAP-type C4-dicarboxylate transport system permease large subunit